MPNSGLLLCSDFFFISKITSTGSALDYPIKSISTAQQLTDQMANPDVNTLFVDLDSVKISPAQIVALVIPREKVKILGFGSHVNTAALKAANEAGFDAIMPRSKLSTNLPQIIEQCRFPEP